MYTKLFKARKKYFVDKYYKELTGQLIMATHLEDIKQQLALVASDKTKLDMLMEFEKTLDTANLYAYKNWISGELVAGPEIERYWFTCKFMYPYKMMPDPLGGMRLHKYGCKVSFEKGVFESPVKVSGRESYRDTYSKAARLKKHPVWIVTIQMPKKFMDERLIDEIDNVNSIGVDTSDISAAYDSGVDEVTDVETGLPADDDMDFGGEEL